MSAIFYKKDDVVLLSEAAVAGDGALRAVPTGNRSEFRILSDGPIGYGSSCAVYTARRTDGAGGVVRLKRCQLRERAGRDRFLRAVRRQTALLEKTNSAAVLLQLYCDGEGLLWTSHAMVHGRTWAEADERDVWKILKNTLYLARGVAEVHAAGELILDLSASNVYQLPDGSSVEGTLFIDFDSCVGWKDGVLEQGAQFFTSEHYGAPEVLQQRTDLIGPRADLYSLGVLAFRAMFGRLPDSSTECVSFADMPFRELRDPLGPDVLSVRARAALEDFFRHALPSDPHCRYPDMAAAAAALEELVRLTDPALRSRPRLARRDVRPVEGFVRRPGLTARVDAAFRNGCKAVLLYGEGGSGKTELARAYAAERRAALDGVDFCVWQEGFRRFEDLAAALDLRNAESEERRLDALAALGPTDLIILDNLAFPEEEDPLLIDLTADGPAADPTPVLRALLERSGEAKLIFTAREQVTLPGVEPIPVESDHALSSAIFRAVLGRTFDGEEGEALARIQAAIGDHTYASDLIAKQMAEYRVTPAAFLRRTEEKGLLDAPAEGSAVRSDKDGRRAAVKSHIMALFGDILLGHAFSLVEMSLMLFLSRAPAVYFDRELLCQVVGDDEEHALARAAADRFCLRGWLKWQEDGGARRVAIHPLVAETLRAAGLKDTFENDFLYRRNMATIPREVPKEFRRCTGGGGVGWERLRGRRARRFDALLGRAEYRRSSGGAGLDEQVRGALTDFAVYGGSYHKGVMDCWVYLAQYDLTVSWLRLRRGYTLEAEALSGEMLSAREKLPAEGEVSAIWAVCGPESVKRFDLGAERHPERPGTLDVTGLALGTAAGQSIATQVGKLFGRPFLRKITTGRAVGKLVLSGPFRGGFTGTGPMTIHRRAFSQGIVLYSAHGPEHYITDLRIPDGVTDLHRGTFFGYDTLERIELPAGLTALVPMQFAELKNLREVVFLGEGVREIPDFCFYKCGSLASLRLPGGLRTIGEYAFFRSGLERLDLPEGLERVGEGAFFGSKQLAVINLPMSLTQIGEGAFGCCGDQCTFGVPVADLQARLAAGQSPAARQALKERCLPLLRYRLLEDARLDPDLWTADHVEAVLRCHVPESVPTDEDMIDWMYRYYWVCCAIARPRNK